MQGGVKFASAWPRHDALLRRGPQMVGTIPAVPLPFRPTHRRRLPRHARWFSPPTRQHGALHGSLLALCTQLCPAPTLPRRRPSFMRMAPSGAHATRAARRRRPAP